MLFSGLLIYGPHAFTVDCTIRNLTENGALVRLPGPVALVAPFTLIDLVHGRAFAADIAWGRMSDRGLAFTGELDLKAPPEDDLGRIVRRLWLERRAR